MTKPIAWIDILDENDNIGNVLWDDAISAGIAQSFDKYSKPSQRLWDVLFLNVLWTVDDDHQCLDRFQNPSKSIRQVWLVTGGQNPGPARKGGRQRAANRKFVSCAASISQLDLNGFFAKRDEGWWPVWLSLWPAQWTAALTRMYLLPNSCSSTHMTGRRFKRRQIYLWWKVFKYHLNI